MIDDHISHRAKTAVTKILRDRLGRAGYTGADIRAARDADGDPIVVVDVIFKFSRKPIDSRIMFGITSEVRGALEALGESRFPHVRFHFDDQQQIAS